MYEFSKKVLHKVSFDRTLFRKELRKALKWLKRDEAILLKAWALATLPHYKKIISEVYKSFN